MKLGVALPLIDVAVGGDPAAIREFTQTAKDKTPPKSPPEIGGNAPLSGVPQRPPEHKQAEETIGPGLICYR